jgi:hypothetical protein
VQLGCVGIGRQHALWWLDAFGHVGFGIERPGQDLGKDFADFGGRQAGRAIDVGVPRAVVVSVAGVDRRWSSRSPRWRSRRPRRWPRSPRSPALYSPVPAPRPGVSASVNTGAVASVAWEFGASGAAGMSVDASWLDHFRTGGASKGMLC